MGRTGQAVHMGEGALDRKYWVSALLKISGPVLRALSQGRLKESMPVEVTAGSLSDDRRPYSHLEAFGRTLAGISPWLGCAGITGEEEALRREYCELSRKAVAAGTDPASPDYLNFSRGLQPIVDAAFFSHALLRAPEELWNKLEPGIRRNVIHCLKATRTRKPCYSNWLLFSAMIEAALYKLGEDWDRMRIDYALKQHEQWYKGDGVYGDGPEFHWDYYNSFVIQPMLVDIISAIGPEDGEWEAMAPGIKKRAVRFGGILERMISPEGTFPPLGRSLAYRFGAFQHLAQMVLQHSLADNITPAQVRCALTAVISRMLELPGTFDENGWLRIGFCGSQPDMGERYVSTGSLYLCATAFLPLGLAPGDEFWTGGPRDWTSRKIWGGRNEACDSALQ